MEREFSFKEQPSSDTVLRVFDDLISRMLEPLVLYTDYGFELAASLLCLLQDNRRKITAKDRNDCSKILFPALMHKDRERLFRAVLDCEVERTIIVSYVDRLLNDNNPTNLRVEYAPLRRHLEVILSMYNRFVNAVLDRYKSVLAYQASVVVNKKSHSGVIISRDDAQQNIRLVALKTLGRFRASSGTLTSYLLKWVSYSDSSRYLVGLGESFGITRNERTKIAKGSSPLNNISVGIEKSFFVADEALSAEETYTARETYAAVLEFMTRSRVLKLNHYGAAVCKIPVLLTDQQKKQLKESLR